MPSLTRKFLSPTPASLAETGGLAFRFVGWLGVFYLFVLSPAGKGAVAGLAAAYVRSAHAIIALTGEQSAAHGATLFSRGLPMMTVVPDCTGSEFLALLCAAILAFPATATARATGLLAGCAWLLGLGLSRIVSLYLVKVHFPGGFQAAHEEGWPAILIVATLVFLIAWIERAQINDHG